MGQPRPGDVGAQLEPCLYALHASATLREVRAAFLRFARDLLCCSAYGVYQFAPGTVAPALIQVRGVSDAYLSRYESDGRACDPLFRRLASELGTVSSDLDLSARAWRDCPLYEINAAGGIGRAIQAALAIDGALVGTLNVARAEHEEPFTPADVDTVALLARHMSLAMARNLRELELDRRRELTETALDVLGLPLVVSGEQADVVFSNRAADRLLHDSGEECATAFAAALAVNVEALTSQGRRVATSTIPVTDAGAAFPSARRAQGRRTGLTVRTARLGGLDATLSFVYETPAAVPVSAPLLSPREREIVELVVRGYSNAQIGIATSISPNTVKQHLKRVFEKLQVHTRAELAAAVSQTAAEEDAPFARPGPEPPSPDGPGDGRASA